MDVRTEGFVNWIKCAHPIDGRPTQRRVLLPSKLSQPLSGELCLSNQSKIETALPLRFQAQPYASRQSFFDVSVTPCAHPVRAVVMITLADHASVIVKKGSHLKVVIRRHQFSNGECDSLR